MNIFKMLLFSFCLLFLIGCSKEETPTPKPDTKEEPKPDPKPDEPTEPADEIYFSYYDDPNEFIGYSTDGWIIIHNQDGELLDYKSFQKGDSLEFESSAEKLKTTNTLSVTTFNYTLGNSGESYHTILTETEIGKGSIWDWTDEFESTLPKPPITNGYSISITVNNVPNTQHYDLTSQSEGFIVGDSFYREIDTLEIWTTLYQDKTYLLSIRDGNDDFKYQWVELPDPIGDITLEYSDFLEYDHVIEVTLPEYESYVASVNAKNKSENYVGGFIISHEGAGRQIRSIAKLGYLDIFDTFLTSFNFHYDEHTRYSFYNVETRPTKIDVPLDPQFQAEHNNLYNYSFTTDVQFYRHISSWVYEDLNQTNRTRYSLAGKFPGTSILGELPSEILEKYPNLNLENLKYEETNLYIGENIDFKTDNRTTYGSIFLPTGHERLIFKNSEE